MVLNAIGRRGLPGLAAAAACFAAVRRPAHPEWMTDPVTEVEMVISASGYTLPITICLFRALDGNPSDNTIMRAWGNVFVTCRADLVLTNLPPFLAATRIERNADTRASSAPVMRWHPL